MKYDSIWPELCGCQPKNNGKTPLHHPFVHRVWNHDFHHPFWGTIIFENTHVSILKEINLLFGSKLEEIWPECDQMYEGAF